MSKASRFATAVAVVFSWIAVSCSGPILFKPPMASADAGKPVLASASVPGTGAAPVAVVPPQTSAAASSVFFFSALLVFVALGATVFALRGKPDQMV